MNRNLTPNHYKDAGKRVELLRGKLNQTEFASLFEATQSDISRIENGSLKKPNIDLLSRICIYYGRNLDWAFYGEGGEAEEISYAVPDDSGHARTAEEAVSASYGDLRAEEKEYLAKLLLIFRTKDRGTRSAITQNIDTFLRVPSKDECKDGDNCGEDSKPPDAKDGGKSTLPKKSGPNSDSPTKETKAV